MSFPFNITADVLFFVVNCEIWVNQATYALFILFSEFFTLLFCGFKIPLYNTDNGTKPIQSHSERGAILWKENCTMMMTILSAVCVLAMTGCSSVSTTESTSGNITAELTETMISSDSETETEAVATEKFPQEKQLLLIFQCY